MGQVRRVTVGALVALAVVATTIPAAGRPIDVGLSGTATDCITHVRWVITAARSVPFTQAAEVTLFNGSVRLSNRTEDPAISVTSPGGFSEVPPEGPEAVYDGSLDTKWIDFALNAGSESTLVIQFPEPVTFDSYQWSTASAEPERDPISWRLEVSTDGVSWTTIDAHSDVAVTTDRSTVVGPFDVAYAGCQTTGKDFGGVRSGGAKLGPGENRDGVLALDPRSRGRVK